MVVPFDHLSTLKSAFHRWSGHNPALHDGMSLYSLSWLHGGRGGPGGLRFPNGAAWSISAPDPDLLRKVLAAILADPDLPGHQMRVTDATWRAIPEFESGQRVFRLLSPVLVKQTLLPPATTHLLYDNPLADEILTDSLRHKLRLTGRDESGVSVAFDRTYSGAKTKLFRYKQVQCRANMCPVLISGSAAQLAFAWCVGVGHSTGLGCGALQ